MKMKFRAWVIVPFALLFFCVAHRNISVSEIEMRFSEKLNQLKAEGSLKYTQSKVQVRCGMG